MPKKRSTLQPPERLVVKHATGEDVYRLRTDVVAITRAGGARVGAEGAYDVVPATHLHGTTCPVYARAGVDEAAVPTGRIFVRRSDGADVDARSVAALGLTIESRPNYAPGAAWVRGADVAAGLGALDALAALPQVTSVEPELLRPKAKR